jgi:hypothetical protein
MHTITCRILVVLALQVTGCTTEEGISEEIASPNGAEATEGETAYFGCWSEGLYSAATTNSCCGSFNCPISQTLYGRYGNRTHNVRERTCDGHPYSVTTGTTTIGGYSEATQWHVRIQCINPSTGYKIFVNTAWSSSTYSSNPGCPVGYTVQSASMKLRQATCM